MRWKRWKAGLAVTVMLSLAVAGSALASGMTWKQFVAVFCTALVTHFGAFVKDHPVDDALADDPPAAPPK